MPSDDSDFDISEDDIVCGPPPSNSDESQDVDVLSESDSEEVDSSDVHTEEDSDSDESIVLPHVGNNIPDMMLPGGRGRVLNRKCDLFEWQEAMVKFMERREKPNSGIQGGIMNAEPGSGKTGVVIERVARDLMSEDGSPGPTLVVVPPIVIKQWADEIRKFYGSRIRVLVFYGVDFDQYSTKSFANYDIVLTSYGVLVSALKDIADNNDIKEWFENLTDAAKTAKSFSVHSNVHHAKYARGKKALFRVKFHRLVLDEGHKVVRRNAASAKAVGLVIAPKRWVFTGTAFRNQIEDIMNLMFLCGARDAVCMRTWNDSKIAEDYFKYIHIVDGVVKTKTADGTVYTAPETIEHAFSFTTDEEELVYEVTETIVNETIDEMDRARATNAQLRVACLRQRQCCIAPILAAVPYKELVIDRAPPEKREEYARVINAPHKHLTHPLVLGTKQRDHILPTILSIPKGEKMAIFSPFTQALSLLKLQLARIGLGHQVVEITGDVPLKQRVIAQGLINSKSEKRIVLSNTLISEGMNLQGVNHCIFIDRWWCPSAELQALRRAFRQGQTKKVTVYHFIATRRDGRETIEHSVRRVMLRKLGDEAALKEGIESQDLPLVIAKPKSNSESELLQLMREKKAELQKIAERAKIALTQPVTAPVTPHPMLTMPVMTAPSFIPRPVILTSNPFENLLTTQSMRDEPMAKKARIV